MVSNSEHLHSTYILSNGGKESLYFQYFIATSFIQSAYHFSLLQLTARNPLKAATLKKSAGKPGNLEVGQYQNLVFLSVSCFTFELLQAAATEDSCKSAGCGKSATKRSSSKVRISNWQKLEFKMPTLKIFPLQCNL